MATKANIIFYGGDIITMDEGGKNGNDQQNPAGVVEAVAIGGGLILAVGSLQEVVRHADRECEMIYLNQQTLMPGFIESHQHAVLCGVRNSYYTVIGSACCKDYVDVSEVMRRRIDELRLGEWAVFFGWDPELVSGLPVLSATYLDDNYSSVNPILVIGQSFHVAWVNSAALKVMGYDKTKSDPVGGIVVRDGYGKPTGQFLESIGEVLKWAPKPGLDVLRKGFEDQWWYYASKGFTTVTELIYTPSRTGNTILEELADRPDCPIRLAVYRKGHVRDYEMTSDDVGSKTETVESVGDYNDRLWDAGVKIIADGSPHCGTAAILEPYLVSPLTEILSFPKAPNCGHIRFGSNEIVSTMRHYHKMGEQIAVHCHGERASEQVLDAYQQVLLECGMDDRRHRMEHCGLTTVDQLERAAKMDLSPSFFVDHLRHYGRIYKTDIFGDRVNRWTPLSEATRLGLTWTIHQDNPAFPGDALPFANMKTAVTRCTKDDPTTPYGPQYRVSVHEALKAYTVNAAWQLHREDEMGTITPGKRADLVVLSKNPYKVDPFNLESIDVIETYLQGRGNGFATITTLPGTNISILQPAGSDGSNPSRHPSLL